MEGEYIINIGKRTIIKMNMKIMTRKNATRRRLRLLSLSAHGEENKE